METIVSATKASSGMGSPLTRQFARARTTKTTLTTNRQSTIAPQPYQVSA